MIRVSGIEQLFIERDTNRVICIMMAKVTDDLLIVVWDRKELEDFLHYWGKCFS